MRNASLAQPPQMLQPDLALLAQILNAPNGWHWRALDPYKRQHMLDAGVALLEGRGDDKRIKVTSKGRDALAHQRQAEWDEQHAGSALASRP